MSSTRCEAVVGVFNVALLWKVARAIRHNPLHFCDLRYQSNGFSRLLLPDSTGDIAAWAILCGTHRAPCRMHDEEIEPLAQRLLGLDEKQAARLFYSDEWPKVWRNAMQLPTWLGDVETRQHNALIAAARIGCFIDSYGRE